MTRSVVVVVATTPDGPGLHWLNGPIGVETTLIQTRHKPTLAFLLAPSHEMIFPMYKTPM